MKNSDPGSIQWQTVQPAILSGFERQTNGGEHWQGKITDPGSACLLIQALDIDASQNKYLYLKIAAGKARSIQVAFAGDGSHRLVRSFRGNFAPVEGPLTLQFDLRQFPLWKGKVTDLWLNIEEAPAGEVVRFYGAGSASQPVKPQVGEHFETFAPQPYVWAMTDRMAAFHQTLVDVDETKPNAEILTYNLDEGVFLGQCLLARLVAYVEVDGKELGPDDSLDLLVEDFPGGVAANYRLGDVRVTFEVVPLLLGRENTEQHGAALYRIQTIPAAPVTVRCGGGMKVMQWGPEQHTHIREDGFGGGDDTVAISGDIALLHYSRQPLPAALRSAGQMSQGVGADGGRYLEIKLAPGGGDILIAFAREAAQAAALAAGIDIDNARQAVEAYYAGLLEARVETPEKVIDGAFRSAIYNLEYNWYQPFGWIECIHHWVQLWHMQHTMGIEWLGQADRSRSTTVNQAERLYPNGAVPMLFLDGQVFRAWGGTNQFFAWQVRHYWTYTAERAFIQQMAPVMDRVIAQTYQEYDPDNDLLLAWREQIGNQEDYSHHPHNGAATSIEGINMLRTRAILARALDDEATARQCEARIAAASANLRQKLWQPDLGRFAYFADPHGIKRPDGLYQEYIYPAIYDTVDALDAWTSMRHLRDRLTGIGGEIYLSNTFPNHTSGTWGMQAGTSQQPWGAWGLAAVGLRNETFAPLRAAGRWVMSDRLRGGWPEISTERYVSYYSPPPAVYIQSVIEALFGLEVNKPEGYLKVAPSFPDEWPAAKLQLPAYQAVFQRCGNTQSYTVESQDSLARQVRWLLPPGRVNAVMVDGKTVEYQLSARVGCQLLAFDTPACQKCEIQVSVDPLQYRVTFPPSIAEGETLQVHLSGCRILKVDDRCGVLSQVQPVTDSNLQAEIRTGLLAPYLKYGRLGLLNFARRSFFLYCQGEDGSLFWQPVDVTILPRFEACQQGELAQSGKSAKAHLTLRNNTFAALEGAANLNTAGGSIPFKISLASRSEKAVTVALPPESLAHLSPGDNDAVLVLPGGERVELILDAASLFVPDSPLDLEAAQKLAPVDLPADALVADESWKNFRTFYNYMHLPWAQNSAPLAALEQPSVQVPGLPVSFQLAGRKLVPVSWKYGQPAFRLDLGGRTFKKLYLLLVPFMDNHDTFTPVGRITLQREDDRLIGRTLYFPGDLDWWCSEKAVDIFCTARLPRPDRHGLLPLLRLKDRDWPQGKPAVSYWSPKAVWTNECDEPWQTSFPQPEYWAACRVLKTSSAVLNVVELDLGRPEILKSLTLSTVGTEPALGLVAVSAEYA
jgi:hypothetical protein